MRNRQFQRKAVHCYHTMVKAIPKFLHTVLSPSLVKCTVSGAHSGVWSRGRRTKEIGLRIATLGSMDIMKRVVKLSVVLAAAGLTLAPHARADAFVFGFSTGSGISITGTLVGNSISPGQYAITSGSAILTDTNWPSGNGVYPLVPDPISPAPTNSTIPVNWFTYDDLLTPAATNGEILNINGLYFCDSSLGLAINIWGHGAGNPYEVEVADSGGYRVGGFGEFTVPEASTTLLSGMMMAALGMGVLAGRLRKIRR
jgi:hypothetical protein